ncbi:MAG: tripartite tricarboxylate transporter substrate binding protein [Ottowia sp.]|uniref:Bug family tripartite tricarboxylate transporter substrate binding protein n=1 Tax=Ottowia sp. TaxID=1898956 RepID=UPI003C7375B1
MLNFRRLATSACLVLSTALTAHAQSFPTKPVTLVSPYQAGGAADAMARAIAEAAGKELGQPVVVESKPGAEGIIGATDVMNAQPDGYRVLWGGAGSLMVATALRKNPPFDPVTAFTPIAATVDFSFFLYVHPSLPVTNMKEFVAYAKANPGKISYATGNNQGLLSMADLAKKYNLDMVKVQYRGETAAATDLITNRVQAIFATTSLMNFAKEGKLRILGTTLIERSPLLPEVPTVIEAGVPVAEFGGGWLGIYGPANMAKPVVEKLNQAFVKAFKSPDVKTKMKNAGLVYIPYATPEALAKYTQDQRDLYRRTIKELNIPQE